MGRRRCCSIACHDLVNSGTMYITKFSRRRKVAVSRIFLCFAQQLNHSRTLRRMSAMIGPFPSPRKGLLGLVAAGLLAATALSANFAFAPPSILHAEQSASVAPATGFADLAAKVMPAVVSVRVDFANVASNDDDGSDSGQQPNVPNLPPDSPFRDFFNQFPQFHNQVPQQQSHRGVAEGSGF